MDTSFLLRGAVIGLSVVAPVGPVGILCIRRVLTEGRVSGVVPGLGAATADAIYGCIAGFGLTFVCEMLISQYVLLRLLGGAFLCYLGIKTFFSKCTDESSSVRGKGLFRLSASTFLLTLANPMSILLFLAIFGGTGIISVKTDYGSSSFRVLGVFLGSSLWWLLLGWITGFFAPNLSKWLIWMNRISGASLIGFSFFIFIDLLYLIT